VRVPGYTRAVAQCNARPLLKPSIDADRTTVTISRIARRCETISSVRPPSLTCETPRLWLRRPNADDFDALFEIHEDPEVLRHLTTVPNRVEDRPCSAQPTMIAAAEHARKGSARVTFHQMMLHWQIRGSGQWVVVEKTTGEVIGRVGLCFSEEVSAVELGWVIRRSRWGHGFATEAARAAAQYAFDMVGVTEVISRIQPSNHASIRIAEKVGATRDNANASGSGGALVFRFTGHPRSASRGEGISLEGDGRAR
jgi:RimJ/RimL family protein N-acetyltransferase